MSSSNKGVVLISILLMVLLLSSVAILFGNKYFLSFKRAQYIEFQTLSLNIFRNLESLSQDKIDELQKELEKHTNEYNILENKSVKEIWLSELEELKVGLDRFYSNKLM